MKKLIIFIVLVLSLQAEVGTFSIMAENAIKVIRLKEIVNTNLDKLSASDKTYEYRLIDVVRLKGDTQFVVLIAKYRDEDSYYNLADILLLNENELERLYNTK